MYVTYTIDGIDNKDLYNIVLNNLKNTVKGGAKVTGFKLHQIKNRSLDSLLNAISKIVPLASHNLIGSYSEDLELVLERNKNSPKEGGGGIDGFDLTAFKIVECWGVLYNEGDQILKHNHFPYSISFCYYLNTLNQSSSLIIEEDVVEVDEGMLVMFPSYSQHYVLPNKSDNRCCINGNLIYSGGLLH